MSRYIEADALIERWNNMSVRGRTEFDQEIMVAPSIDIEPKRGGWIDISEWYTPKQKCSICETIVDGYGSNFCPNCGARMKGADDE